MTSITERNYALDYFRTIALAMMVAAHFYHFFLTFELGTWGSALHDIMEAAPAVFFIAFGMTMLHNASKANKWRSFLELGIVSLFHQIHICKGDVTQPSFLLFLWMMYFLIILLKPIFADKWFRVIFAAALILVNLFVGHEEFGWLGAYPFGVIPWAYYVIIGISLGIAKPDRKGMINLIVAAIGLTVVGLVIPSVSPYLGENLRLGGITKWDPTTSAYLLMTSGLSLLLYLLLNLFRYNPENAINSAFVFVSRFLLLGTVTHYLTNRMVRFFVLQSGYSEDTKFPIVLLIVTSAVFLGSLYIAMLLLADLRSMVLHRWLDEKAIYKYGWLVSILLLLVTIPIFLIQENSVLVQWMSFFGMAIAAWTFMRWRKDEVTPL